MDRNAVMNQFVMNLLRIGRAVVLTAATLVALGVCRECVASHGAAEHEPAEAVEEATSDSKTGGIKLGEFRIRSDYPAEAQKSTVKFVLYAAVKGDQSADMKRLVEEHQQKLRDQIITATRLAPLAVFEEPDLATFRRRLLIRLRRVMPELVVEDLYITDFNLLVKSL